MKKQDLWRCHQREHTYKSHEHARRAFFKFVAKRGDYWQLRPYRRKRPGKKGLSVQYLRLKRANDKGLREMSGRRGRGFRDGLPVFLPYFDFHYWWGTIFGEWQRVFWPHRDQWIKKHPRNEQAKMRRSNRAWEKGRAERDRLAREQAKEGTRVRNKRRYTAHKQTLFLLSLYAIKQTTNGHANSHPYQSSNCQ